MEYNDYMLKTQICAERMKTLREERGLTMDELAEKVGMSPCSVYYYEHSKHVPNIITLIKYAMYFGVSTDYLLGMEEDAEIIAAALRVMLVDTERDEEHQQTYVLWWVNGSGQLYKYGEYESLKMAVKAYRDCRQGYADFEPMLIRLTSEDITKKLREEELL